VASYANKSYVHCHGILSNEGLHYCKQMISKDVTIYNIEISQSFMAPNSCHGIDLHICE
jgi:hypothetical protein